MPETTHRCANGGPTTTPPLGQVSALCAGLLALALPTIDLRVDHHHCGRGLSRGKLAHQPGRGSPERYWTRRDGPRSRPATTTCSDRFRPIGLQRRCRRSRGGGTRRGHGPLAHGRGPDGRGRGPNTIKCTQRQHRSQDATKTRRSCGSQEGSTNFYYHCHCICCDHDRTKQKTQSIVTSTACTNNNMCPSTPKPPKPQSNNNGNNTDCNNNNCDTHGNGDTTTVQPPTAKRPTTLATATSDQRATNKRTTSDQRANNRRTTSD